MEKRIARDLVRAKTFEFSADNETALPRRYATIHACVSRWRSGA